MEKFCDTLSLRNKTTKNAARDNKKNNKSMNDKKTVTHECAWKIKKSICLFINNYLCDEIF